MSLLALLVGAGVALAHHDTATSRVAPPPTAGVGLGMGLEPATPRLEPSLSLGSATFDRPREGAGPYTARPLGSVSVATLVPGAALSLSSGTRIGLSLPIGGLWVTSGEGERSQRFGPGDLRLDVDQRLDRAFAEEGPWRLGLRAVGIAPTGAYEGDAALSVTEVEGGDAGEILLVTYDTQASLGAGVWSAGGGLSAGLALSPRLLLQAGGDVLLPLTRTPDAIAWGPDLTGDLVLGAGLVPDRLQLAAGGSLRRHGRDEVPGIDETTGDAVRTRVGGRTELAATAALTARVARGLRCGVDGRLPLWRTVGGVQLTEGWAAGMTCTGAVSLRRQDPPGDSAPARP